MVLFLQVKDVLIFRFKICGCSREYNISNPCYNKDMLFIPVTCNCYQRLSISSFWHGFHVLGEYVSVCDVTTMCLKSMSVIVTATCLESVSLIVTVIKICANVYLVVWW